MMESVTVGASKKYEVIIGSGILRDCGELIARVKAPCLACIVTDDIVDGLYAGTVEESLRSAGFSVVKHVFPNGEQSKCLECYGRLLDVLAAEGVTRTDLIVALGGGVCGDMAGFAAATYLRGMDYVQIPTTFLAAIDSSVGGKTAIDISAGKNLVGAFHQPIEVICDTETLSTLRPETFADGAAEAIKYGVLSDPEIFDIFSEGRIREELQHVIKRSVEIKSEYVEKDEFDTGLRMYLNLGHTPGHAIEKLSHFSVTHGHAVATGMVMVADISEKLGFCEAGTAERIRQVLQKNQLPISTSFDAAELGEAALTDKKRRGASIRLILPVRIGECMLYETDAEKLPELFALSDAVKG